MGCQGAPCRGAWLPIKPVVSTDATTFYHRRLASPGRSADEKLECAYTEETWVLLAAKQAMWLRRIDLGSGGAWQLLLARHGRHHLNQGLLCQPGSLPHQLTRRRGTRRAAPVSGTGPVCLHEASQPVLEALVHNTLPTLQRISGIMKRLLSHCVRRSYFALPLPRYSRKANLNNLGTVLFGTFTGFRRRAAITLEHALALARVGQVPCDTES